jgi:hypothetical protein
LKAEETFFSQGDKGDSETKPRLCIKLLSHWLVKSRT